MNEIKKVPFTYTSKSEFQDKLIEWIGDILYDFLPEHGYEVRDEQIFTAFQIAEAFCKKKVHLAEAGLGTGKTFAYLLAALPYARMTGKPVVISCASPALQEQLAAEGGDIDKLSQLLGLDIDAKMAKDPTQYICDQKVEEVLEDEEELTKELMIWLKETIRGERSEVPYLSDKLWKKIAWNEGMSCEVCTSRGYCKQVSARNYYRDTQDLIIVDHETFFHDLWTRQERLDRGQLPILPSYSGVVFDEGHKIMMPAAMQAGQKIVQEDILTMIGKLEEIQGARDSFYEATEDLEDKTRHFFERVEKYRCEDKDYVTIPVDRLLWQGAMKLRAALDQVLMELQIEQELYLEEIPQGVIEAYETQIESATKGLAKMCSNQGQDVITWLNQKEDSFYIVPRALTKMLHEALYVQQIPVIFSSATLSNNGDFSYLLKKIGIKDASKSTIGSPFNMKEQVTISFEKQTIEALVEVLLENGGRGLILTSTIDEVRQLRQHLKHYTLPFTVYYEDEADRGYLIRNFKSDETSVLIGANFWEGIDVPGDALNLLVIWSLPFQQLDPLVEIERKEVIEEGLNPAEKVDYPEMSLKLKQGCGRLIRTEQDRGKIILMCEVLGKPWEAFVRGALPHNGIDVK